MFQLYTRQFISIKQINSFLQQFHDNELEPIQIHICDSNKLNVIFKTKTIWTKSDLEYYGLYEREQRND